VHLFLLDKWKERKSPVDHCIVGHGMRICLEDQKPQPKVPLPPRRLGLFLFLGASVSDLILGPFHVSGFLLWRDLSPASAAQIDCVKGLSPCAALAWIALARQEVKGDNGVKQSMAMMTSASTIADRKSSEFNA
jgi:hypothetical protein